MITYGTRLWYVTAQTKLSMSNFSIAVLAGRDCRSPIKITTGITSLTPLATVPAYPAPFTSPHSVLWRMVETRTVTPLIPIVWDATI